MGWTAPLKLIGEEMGYTQDGHETLFQSLGATGLSLCGLRTTQLINPFYRISAAA